MLTEARQEIKFNKQGKNPKSHLFNICVLQPWSLVRKKKKTKVQILARFAKNKLKYDMNT